MTRATQALLIVALAWGAFAFGGVYKWAWWPLVIALQLAAWTAVFTSRPSRPLQLVGLSLALIASLVASLLQLIPIPIPWLRVLSPTAMEPISQLDPMAAAGLVVRHALSISPPATADAIIVSSAVAATIIGSAYLFTRRGARPIAERITIVGVLMAFVGIVQRPLYAGRIYGFWQPLQGGNPFGPFVNKNHFAGWMLMALPLTLGLICSSIAHGMRGLKPGLRQRLLWLTSADASRLVLLSGAATLMALSLVLTMSRSGLCAFLLAIAITSTQVLRRQETRARKIAAVVILLSIGVSVLSWVGIGAIAQQFSATDWSEFNDRLGAWSDAVGVARRFPVAGTGLGTYEFATLFYQRHDLAQHYAQAHNDYLQLAAEGGAFVALPFLAGIVVFIRTVRSRFADETSMTAYWVRVGAVTGLAAIALQETVDFSLQMPGNAALFAVLCGLALHRAPEHPRVRTAGWA